MMYREKLMLARSSGGMPASESERDADTRSMSQGRGVNNVDTEPPGFGDAGDEPLVNEKI
jgi:hypothetical protein